MKAIVFLLLLFALGFSKEMNLKKKEEGKFIDEIKTALQDSPYKSDAMYGQFHNANIFKVDSELDLEP